MENEQKHSHPSSTGEKILVSRLPEDAPVLVTLVARILFVLWLVFLVIALLQYANGDETLLFLALFFGAPITLAFLFLETIAWVVRSRRKWIRLFDDQFEYITRRSSVVYALDDIEGVSTEHRAHPQSNGWLPEKTTHFWLRDGLHIEVVAIGGSAVGDACPQEQIADQLKKHYLDKANCELKKGKSIHGKNWSLDQRVLRMAEKNGGESSISLDTIAHAEIFEKKLFVWDCYDSSPRLVLPIQSQNATFLNDILQSRLMEHKPVDSYGNLNDDSNRGRMLYRSTWCFKTAWCLFIFNIIVVSIFVCSFIYVSETYIWGVIFSALALVVTAFLALAGKAITVFEKGMIYKNAFCTQELVFDQVGQYTLRQADSYKYGMYLSSTFSLILISDVPHLKRFSLTLSSQTPDLPGPMRNIKDRVHAICVDKLWRQLESENGAKWTDDVTLRKNEIIIATREKTYRIAYQDLSVDWEHIFIPVLGICTEPHLKFFVKGNDSQNPIFKLSVHKDNFYPGYECLGWMIDVEGNRYEQERP